MCEMRGGEQPNLVADMRMVRPRTGWPADIAPTLNAAFGSKLGLEDQHIRGGRNVCSPQWRCASMPGRWGGRTPKARR
jgi:hypothetical protein